MYIHDVWGGNTHATVLMDFRGQPCGVSSRYHTQITRFALPAFKILISIKFHHQGFFSYSCFYIVGNHDHLAQNHLALLCVTLQLFSLELYIWVYDSFYVSLCKVSNLCQYSFLIFLIFWEIQTYEIWSHLPNPTSPHTSHSTITPTSYEFVCLITH